MVNVELLKKHASQYKLTRDTMGEYHKQLFKLHPELAKYYDAEDIDPDSIPKGRVGRAIDSVMLDACKGDFAIGGVYNSSQSAIFSSAEVLSRNEWSAQKFMMLGQQELQFFFRLPTVMHDERDWRSTLASFKETFADNNNMPMSEFNKVTDAFLAAMQKNAGGVTPEQKKEWEALLAKAYADMKTWGWY